MTPLSREVKGHPKIWANLTLSKILETHTIHEAEDKTPPLAWLVKCEALGKSILVLFCSVTYCKSWVRNIHWNKPHIQSPKLQTHQHGRTLLNDQSTTKKVLPWIQNTKNKKRVKAWPTHPVQKTCSLFVFTCSQPFLGFQTSCLVVHHGCRISVILQGQDLLVRKCVESFHLQTSSRWFLRSGIPASQWSSGVLFPAGGLACSQQPWPPIGHAFCTHVACQCPGTLKAKYSFQYKNWALYFWTYLERKTKKSHHDIFYLLINHPSIKHRPKGRTPNLGKPGRHEHQYRCRDQGTNGGNCQERCPLPCVFGLQKTKGSGLMLEKYVGSIPFYMLFFYTNLSIY